MFSSRIRVGVRAGLVAAAATAGAIIGFGLRHSDWSAPFASLGGQVMRGFGVTTAPHFVSSATGLMAHVAWMILWGIAFAAMAHRRSPRVVLIQAVLLGTGVALVARSFVPAALGAVRFGSMPATQAALCVGLMTAGLLTGRALSRTG